MNGWISLILLVLLTGAGIWWFGRPRRGHWELIVAALLVGTTGYALQGRATLEGAPRFSTTAASRFDQTEADVRVSLTDRFGPGAKWMTMSDAFSRSGDTEAGANVILSGLKESPKDPNLWVGLGNALVTHNGGILSPAAEYAYRQAMRYDKQGIASRFFYGLSLARSGQLQPAKEIWVELLPLLPETHPLHAQVQRNIGMIDQALAPKPAP